MAAAYSRKQEVGQRLGCPTCFEPWPDALARPFRLQGCDTCRAEKRRRMEAAQQAYMERRQREERERETEMARLTPAERKALADKAYEELYGP